MKIVVSGASGLLGSALVRVLRAEGHEVVSLTRKPPVDASEVFWDPMRGELDPGALGAPDAVVHLAGAGISDRRWNEAYKRKLLDSRTRGTGTLAKALAGLPQMPAVMISSSATGFYGDTQARVVDEAAPQGHGFLADLAGQWEAATIPAKEAGIRVVTARSGIVLAKSGGMLGKVLPMFKIGLGAQLGNGRQYLSWVSLPDWLRAVRFLLTEADLAGPVNVTAPRPVTNAEFTRAVGKAVRRPTMPIPTPAFALRLAVGELADEGLLIGQRVIPARLTDAGFSFEHPDIETALAALLGKPGPRSFDAS